MLMQPCRCVAPAPGNRTGAQGSKPDVERWHLTDVHVCRALSRVFQRPNAWNHKLSLRPSQNKKGLHPAPTGSCNPNFPVQVHPGPYLHCGPQVQTAFEAACCTGIFWQPQAQLWPGQLVHVHGFWVVAFIVFFL